MKHDLFISYSRVDSAFALRLVQDLKQRGVETWFDQLDIPAGSNWDNEIEKALDHAQTIVVVLSAASAKSENVKNEIGAALERGKQVVPIVLAKGAVPLMITRLQREDFTGEYEVALSKLVHRLSGGSRTASMRAISPQDVAQIASEAAKRLGLSGSNELPDSLSPATVVRATDARDAGGSVSPKARHTLLAALGGALVAGGLALAFVLSQRAEPEHVERSPQPVVQDLKVPPVVEANAHAAVAPVEEVKPAPVPEPVPTPAPPSPLPIKPIKKDAKQDTPTPQPKPITDHVTNDVVVNPNTDVTPAPEPAPEPPRLQALFCRETNYGGTCRKLMSRSSMSGTKVENDEASSMRLNTCRSVTVCNNDGLSGVCETFTTDQPDLGRTSVGDNSVSSFECHGPSDDSADDPQ